MKKLFITILFNLIILKTFSQFEEKLTNSQFNRVCDVFKGLKADFGEYSFNNIPCSLCSGGHFFLHNNNNLEASYSYSGIIFNGVLKYPTLTYDENSKDLFVTCKWFNLGSNGGFKTSLIRFEYSLDKINDSWNTIIRFQAGNTEMVAFYLLTKKQLSDISNFLLNNTQFGKNLKDRETKQRIEIETERRNKFLHDSINNENVQKQLILKKQKDLESENLKRINDSLTSVKEDSIKSQLVIGSRYMDGIVIIIDSSDKSGQIVARSGYFSSISETGSVTKKNNIHGVVISNIEKVSTLRESIKLANELGQEWRLPTKSELETFFLLTYKNHNVKDFYNNTLSNVPSGQGSIISGNIDWWWALSEKSVNPTYESFWMVMRKNGLIRKTSLLSKYFKDEKYTVDMHSRLRFAKDF